MTMDLILSSGFLAFARHCGFLAAVEKSGVQATGVCGTSSGALVGALWLSGMSAREIAAELGARRPLVTLRPSATPWRGLCSSHALVTRLRRFLPATFDQLRAPLGVGVSVSVSGGAGRGRLLHAGPLPEAVAASCCVPWLFSPVRIDGELYRDGGVVDRLFLAPWSEHRGDVDKIVHLVGRTAGAAGEPIGLNNLPVVRTPRSGASFWSLGDFWGQFREAEGLADKVLAKIK